jgi:hypothetical protein
MANRYSARMLPVYWDFEYLILFGSSRLFRMHSEDELPGSAA